jgi:hypothetical protein
MEDALIKGCIMTGAKNFSIKPIARNTVLTRITSILGNAGFQSKE